MGARSQSRLLLTNGTVFTGGAWQKSDLRIVGEKIAEIAGGLSPEPGESCVDVTGRHLLPGGVDPHVHLSTSDPAPPFVADDFESGSAAALAGGITTVANMTFANDPESLLATLERDHPRVAAQAMADIVLHPVLDPSRALGHEELPNLRSRGVSTLKLFTLLPTFEQARPKLLRLFEAARDLGLLTLVHCEDFGVLNRANEELFAQGRGTLRYFAESRPVEAEVCAVEAVIALCERSRAPTYVVHLSSRLALEACRAARAQGAPLYVESRPVYFQLTRECYQRKDGPLFVVQPPLRERSDREALWEGLADGSIDTLGSDHVGWSRAQKLDPAHDLANLRPGVPDLEYMLPLIYSEGVRRGRLTIERFVDLTATHPAKLLGLYPTKGVLAPGSDADMAVWDFEARRRLDGARGRSRAGFCAYEGQELQGWPVMTVRRGEIVFDDGRVLAVPGSGRLLRCGPTQPLRS